MISYADSHEIFYRLYSGRRFTCHAMRPKNVKKRRSRCLTAYRQYEQERTPGRYVHGIKRKLAVRKTVPIDITEMTDKNDENISEF